jgi:hypothetical protein
VLSFISKIIRTKSDNRKPSGNVGAGEDSMAQAHPMAAAEETQEPPRCAEAINTTCNHRREPHKIYGISVDRWIELFFAFAVMCATFVYVYISSSQLTAMSGQLNEAKRQRLSMEAQLRANLRRERPSLQPIGENDKLIGKGERILGWNINPKWVNVGATDARNVVSWWDLKVLPLPAITDETRVLGECPYATRPNGKIISSIVPKDGDILEMAKVLRIKDAQDAYGSGAISYIYIFGRLEYTDIFNPDKIHFFDWCVLASPNDLPSGTFSFFKIREETD